ncbi:S-adenosylmethionine decarboxylase proenzyme isoform X2 [Sitodiplosis mosellana]|uniref:S-adenosylmethionine decarboxylase proenzyme isoform X2 n=1 Tax=Sitodiplosis mosellana TaxID=263140 RepID=UPI002444F10B|nr:S-adenosylmethionine decarboxylase proenzyme isoform X2 [Sitodiplosis mosellana]
MSENESISNPQYFEGVEKLLEIWFTPNPSSKNADLRKIPRSMWDALLKSVRCEIISFKRNDQIDAYVLSESSMFVSKRRWILKTCGTTTPLECIEPLLQMAETLAGYVEVDYLFYSRKNFKRPDLQVSPHRSFEEEVTLLDTFFDSGRAYCLGSLNRDCWYLYTYNREGGIAAQQYENVGNGLSIEPDQTIEILMTDLDPDVMAIFTKEECKNATEATQRSGIEKLLPDMIIDDYQFEPCGYSMNGISKHEGCYMTIHITPEPEFSYVSFESNVAASNYSDLISRVIKVFQPSKFLVTIFVSKTSKAIDAGHELDYKTSIGEWKRRDIQYCRFPGYDLTYAHYTKFPS